MPNCFQLKSKATGEAASLSLVDDELCDSLGLQWHMTYYAHQWHDWIGLLLATGHNFRAIARQFRKMQWDSAHDTRDFEHFYNLRRINVYLAKHYTVDAWYEVRR
jgi:hypothetical protein